MKRYDILVLTELFRPKKSLSENELKDIKNCSVDIQVEIIGLGGELFAYTKKLKESDTRPEIKTELEKQQQRTRRQIKEAQLAVGVIESFLLTQQRATPNTPERRASYPESSNYISSPH